MSSISNSSFWVVMKWNKDPVSLENQSRQMWKYERSCSVCDTRRGTVISVHHPTQTVGALVVFSVPHHYCHFSEPWISNSLSMIPSVVRNQETYYVFRHMLICSHKHTSITIQGEYLHNIFRKLYTSTYPTTNNG